MQCSLLNLLMMILKKNEPFRELTVNIILTMLMDEKILHCFTDSKDELREILSNLPKTENHFLSNNILSVLQRISP